MDRFTKHNQQFVVAEMDNRRGYFGIYALMPYKVSRYAKDMTSIQGFPSEENAESFAREYLTNKDK